MRTWIRSRVSIKCGYCRKKIEVGDPLLEIENCGAKLARCKACGTQLFGEPPPDLLPDNHAVQRPLLPSWGEFLSGRRYADQVRADVKQRQTGERE